MVRYRSGGALQLTEGPPVLEGYRDCGTQERSRLHDCEMVKVNLPWRTYSRCEYAFRHEVNGMRLCGMHAGMFAREPASPIDRGTDELDVIL